MNWQYLQRKQIDPLKWNECICITKNGRLYGLVEYLDSCCENWDAIVFGNYEAVMPLPWKSKFGIRYVYAPFFIQHLGLFGNQLDPLMYSDAFKVATSHFRWIDYNVDHSLGSHAENKKAKSNFILDLNRAYNLICANYTEECRKNIQKAIQRNCVFDAQISITEVIGLFRNAYGHLHTAQDNDYNRFQELICKPSSLFKVHAGGVREEKTNELIYAGLLIEFRDRLYYALGAPNAKGRQARATYFFIDQFIQRFADSKRIFDFEGSELPNVADFYQRFGPEKEEYFHVTINNLPWFVKWFKS